MEQHDFSEGFTSRSSRFATLATLDLDGLADELRQSANNMAIETPRLALGLYRLGEIPMPSDGWHQAAMACRRLGSRLLEIGGLSLMVGVYDRAVDRYGYGAVRGVSAQWEGLGGWAS